MSPSKSWNKCFKRPKYIYRVAKRLLSQYLELMPFLNAMLNQKEALLMSFKPNLQHITECTMNTAITAFHMQVTACPLIQLLLLNLSSIQRISHCYKVNKQNPPNIMALSQMDLPAGWRTRRTKSTQVWKGTQNTNKRARTVVEQYIMSVTMPVVGGFAASATADSPPQMQPLIHASF